jgi:hypothetical protein
MLQIVWYGKFFAARNDEPTVEPDAAACFVGLLSNETETGSYSGG